MTYKSQINKNKDRLKLYMFLWMRIYSHGGIISKKKFKKKELLKICPIKFVDIKSRKS